MEYPEEIYKTRDGGLLAPEMRSSIFNVAWGRIHAYKVGHEAGYAEGLAKGLAERTDPLAGYSNLTAAISAKEPIDWEKLDGLKVQCVNPEVRGEIHGTLKQDGSLEPYLPGAWWDRFSNAAYINALYDGWYGNDGWTLWVEGEIPLRRKTADQLKVGTYFLGEAPSGEPDLVYVGGCSEASKVIFYAPSMLKSGTPAYGWVVLEEHGTFQGPEGK